MQHAELVKKAKDWFGDGEVDVDLMIASGAITEEKIIDMYTEEVLTSYIVRKLYDQANKFSGYAIFCPGCKCGHLFDSRWTFNNDFEKPTFSPSMLVNQHQPERRCHSFVKNGNIEFLNDCFHELRGKTVPLEKF